MCSTELITVKLKDVFFLRFKEAIEILKLQQYFLWMMNLHDLPTCDDESFFDCYYCLWERPMFCLDVNGRTYLFENLNFKFPTFRCLNVNDIIFTD